MDSSRDSGRDRGLTAINGAVGLLIVLLIVQMALLTTTLEALLAGHDEAVVPGAILSGVLLVACAGLYFFVRRVDRSARRRTP